MPPLATLMVSETGMAGTTPSAPPRAASTTRTTRSGVTRQREPSWTRTIVSGSSSQRSRPFLVERERASPGRAQLAYFLIPASAASSSILGRSPTA